ncbi:MAG TPA: hypothetical protein VG056_17425 [Pirellulales bacterium]|jgi:hypothetical protein|nr:hypothetical protein [Pirellulales bacterium]
MCGSAFDTWRFILAIVAIALLIAPAAASEPVTVVVASGRQFTGMLDARSNQTQLFLRVAENSIVLLRPVDLDRVVGAQAGGKKLSVADLRAAIANLKSAQPADDSEDERPRHEQLDSNVASDIAAKPTADESTANAADTAQVRAIQIEATLGHWMPGTETSGIVVTVWPIDGQGNLVAVDGTLEVELLGQRFTVVTEGNGFPCLGRWVAGVRTADFGPSGAVYQFPFQAVHPDFTFDLDPHGLVHARLSVPGQGVFEASQAMVRVRPYSSVRDRAQQTTGSRFLPIERLDGRQQ